MTIASSSHLSPLTSYEKRPGTTAIAPGLGKIASAISLTSPIVPQLSRRSIPRVYRDAIEVHVSRRPHPPSPISRPVPYERPCLGCGTIFLAAHNGNGRCPTCLARYRKIEDWTNQRNREFLDSLATDVFEGSDTDSDLSSIGGEE